MVVVIVLVFSKDKRGRVLIDMAALRAFPTSPLPLLMIHLPTDHITDTHSRTTPEHVSWHCFKGLFVDLVTFEGLRHVFLAHHCSQVWEPVGAPSTLTSGRKLSRCHARDNIIKPVDCCVGTSTISLPGLL